MLLCSAGTGLDWTTLAVAEHSPGHSSARGGARRRDKCSVDWTTQAIGQQHTSPLRAGCEARHREIAVIFHAQCVWLCLFSHISVRLNATSLLYRSIASVRLSQVSRDTTALIKRCPPCVRTTPPCDDFARDMSLSSLQRGLWVGVEIPTRGHGQRIIISSLNLRGPPRNPPLLHLFIAGKHLHIHDVLCHFGNPALHHPQEDRVDDRPGTWCGACGGYSPVPLDGTLPCPFPCPGARAIICAGRFGYVHGDVPLGAHPRPAS